MEGGHSWGRLGAFSVSTCHHKGKFDLCFRKPLDEAAVATNHVLSQGKFAHSAWSGVVAGLSAVSYRRVGSPVPKVLLHLVTAAV